ncbi:MAG: DUF4212 domain-containing protein [Comamonadaceae bacterium]|nr:MAG: DUF4212 domain-containing protein [Comamonadaceae bacterium]
MAQTPVQHPAADPDPVVGVPFPPDLHDARHLWLKAGLLSVWALVSFVACYYARDLQWPVGPWPLGYWIAAQGAVLVFIALVFIYCWAMNRFERQDAQATCGGAAAAAAAASTDA